VTNWDIQILALFPNIERGILVITAEGSIVTGKAPAAETAVSLNAGGVKVTGCQSSIKNPIVLATGGSTGGTIVSPPEDGPGGAAFLLQLKKAITTTKAMIIFCIVMVDRPDSKLKRAPRQH
jgi:hypothetical protein